MIKEAIYKKEAAQERANELANEHNGYVKTTSVNSANNEFCFEELDSWSGETAAFEVRDENHETVAYIAYYE